MATLSQQVYEAVEGLKAKGVKGADAFKQVAEQQGKTLSAVRGNYYSHARKLGGGTGSGRRRSGGDETFTAEGAVKQARALLQRALREIDREVEVAERELERAKARRDEVVSSIAERKKTLEKQIKALS